MTFLPSGRIATRSFPQHFIICSPSYPTIPLGLFHRLLYQGSGSRSTPSLRFDSKVLTPFPSVCHVSLLDPRFLLLVVQISDLVFCLIPWTSSFTLPWLHPAYVPLYTHYSDLSIPSRSFGYLGPIPKIWNRTPGTLGSLPQFFLSLQSSKVYDCLQVKPKFLLFVQPGLVVM